MSIEEWPLSTEELLALRLTVGQKISMVKAVQHYGRNVEEVASPTFTHRCTCPNLEHKQGNEKTPSFFFSEKDKTFMCFGCHIRGDVFDFLARMLKRPVEEIVKGYAKKNGIDASDIPEFDATARLFDIQQMKHDVCMDIRDYVVARKEIDTYKSDCEWADNLFRRIDDRFDKFTEHDYQQARFFTMQIGVELERRNGE